MKLYLEVSSEGITRCCFSLFRRPFSAFFIQHPGDVKEQYQNLKAKSLQILVLGLCKAIKQHVTRNNHTQISVN